MKVYIASSWKNQHAVELVTEKLRALDIEVLSFVENNHGEKPKGQVPLKNGEKEVPFDEWCASEMGHRSFVYDTRGATESDLVIYIGPSGCDAWAEVGAAWSRGVKIIGLISKGEQVGLMRRMVHWVSDVRELFNRIDQFITARKAA